MIKGTDHLTIRHYLEGKLDPRRMHQLEKRALEDPFLADALEGFTHTSQPNHGLSILQRQLHERIAHLQENKKVFDLSWQRLSVAAAAAVMFILAGILFWMNSQQHVSKTPAQHKQVEVNLSNPDHLQQGDQAVPVNGWDTYKKYLTENSRKFKPEKALHGKVLVGFVIQPDGTPGDFRILKGINETYNAEAIRLIRKGPAWNRPPSGKAQETKIEVLF